MVDPVAEHVQVLVLAVDRGDLGGGHHPHAVERAGRQRLVHAVHGVVVGERQQPHAGLGGVLHHLGRRELAVGVQRVRLEVEGRGPDKARAALLDGYAVAHGVLGHHARLDELQQVVGAARLGADSRSAGCRRTAGGRPSRR